MKIQIGLGIMFFSQAAFSASVMWNVFTSGEVTVLGEKSKGITISASYKESTPEIGILYLTDAAGSIIGINGKGDQNIGWNAAIWVDAMEGDILSKSYFECLHSVLSDSYSHHELYGDRLSPNATSDSIDVTNPSTVYLALLGNDMQIADPSNMSFEFVDYYGWIELSVSGTEVTLVSSAISDSPLIVGGGLIPEPSGGLLLILGVAMLALKRKTRARNNGTTRP